MHQHTIMIIGLGRIGLGLLSHLSRTDRVICLDSDPAARDRALRAGGAAARIVTADATSRLALEDAGVDRADTVLITTTTEKVTIEVARVLHEHFTCPRVIAVGITPSGIETLHSLNVEVENMFEAGIVGILNVLAQKSRTAHGIGLGKREIREVDVHPNSKLAGKQVRSIGSLQWRVGLIYRNGEIVVPGGDTILRPRDRVVILGQPSVMDTVSDLLTFRFQRFPLEYGPRILAGLSGTEPERFFQELAWLISAFPLTGVTFSFMKPLPPKTCDELLRTAARLGVAGADIADSTLTHLAASPATARSTYGLVVLSGTLVHGTMMTRARGTTKKLVRRLLPSLQAPLLIARGTFPYHDAAVACVPGIDTTHVMENTLEMATLLHNRTIALLVQPPEYISSEDDLERYATMKKNIADMSTVYRQRVTTVPLGGNPIRAILPRLPDHNLLILDGTCIGPARPLTGLLAPDVHWAILSRSTISTLLVPEAEGAL